MLRIGYLDEAAPAEFLDEAAADGRTARACTATKCEGMWRRLAEGDRGGFGHGSGITAAFVLRRELELRRPWNSLWCYLYAFCNCLPQRSN